MFIPQNRIIIVDDNEAHLAKLANVFTTSGISCRTIHYTAEYNTPLIGVRIAFFDINISEKSIDLTQKVFDYKTDRTLSAAFNDLANAIQSTIHSDNGPYALVFWSQNTILMTNFVEYVRDAGRGFSNIPSPILLSSIDKADFLQKTVPEFEEKINEIFNQSSVKLLLEFENETSNAASKIIDEIFKIIPKNPLPEQRIWANYIEFENNFDLVFSTIAVKTLGNAQGKSNPDKAIFEALIPCLENEILKKGSSKDIWKKSLKSLTQNKIEFPIGFNQGKLNSIFHIDKSDKKKNERGVVISLDQSDTYLLNSLDIKDIDKWFNTLIPFGKGKNSLKKEIRSRSKLIAIEISASCDFTNNKSRINKYILGYITPLINIKKDLDIERLSPSSYNLGEVYFNKEEDFQIWLNLNYVLGTTPDDIRLGEPLFVLKKEIMDMIGNKYASHVSRIGITSF